MVDPYPRLTSARPKGGTRAASTLLLLLCVSGGSWSLASSPIVDSKLTDWCAGAPSYTANGGGRVEDSAAQLSCGTCNVSTNLACNPAVPTDCPAGESCLTTGTHGAGIPNAKSETVWWDNRTDGAVNDLGTVDMTSDSSKLYVGAELWVDPDPASLPFGEIAIDFTSGGLSEWHDPRKALTAPGRCSVSTDRGCTSNEDCHFCGTSDEPTGGCSVTTTKSCINSAQCPAAENCIHRIRACGSACDAGDTCNTSQTCIASTAGRKANIGLYASPQGKADFLLVFDFSFWLAGTGDAVLLMRPRTPADPVDPNTKWIPVTGCATGDGVCHFPPAVNPGASGGSGGPPGSVEVAIPWTAFGCPTCPTGFGPGVPFRFNMTVARGQLAFGLGGQQYNPTGAHEDLMSEAVAMTTSTTTNSCPGMGIGNTFCELGEGSSDAFVLRSTALASEAAPGGRIFGLKGTRVGAQITLSWLPSCSTSDTGYLVYEGTVGSWYSHVPVSCVPVGTTTSTFVPGAGNRYYLVVPTNGANEGSYGKNSNSVERPASTSACVPQSVGTCP
jgi:hypothetical protein